MYKAPRFLLGCSIGVATLVGAVGLSGCHNASSSTVVADNSGPDPADINMIPASSNQQQAAPPAPMQSAPARVMGIRSVSQPQQSAEQYPPQADASPAPPPQDESYAPDQTDQDYNDFLAEADEPTEYANEPPPPLPVYEQPEAPEPNYIWTPGYWSWGTVGYFWVPGAWCAPPYYGALWTPGYWAFHRGRYGFHRGFWGPHIGFYGGINYGFGYTGSGYHGGYWSGNTFYYNRAVNHININRINHVYASPIVVNNHYRIAYNGGRGGLNVRPQSGELAAMRGPRTPPMSTQLQYQREAAQNRQQFFNQNRGRPAMVTATRPIPADRGIQRPNPAMMTNPPGQPNNRSGQPQTESRQGQFGIRPGQPNNRSQIQPGQPENRPGQPQFTQPAQPQSRPMQPQARPVEPRFQQQPRPQPQISQPQARPVQPMQQQRPAQQARPMPQAGPQPQARPQPTPRPGGAPGQGGHPR